MLTELSDADDIIAVSVSGRLEKADLEQVMQRLDAAFAHHEKVHIYAEVRAFEGMSLEAWLSDIRHGLGYLRHLGQFGRIAIVSDQSWIRTASRIESALLPFVSYEVFTPENRDRALAWVRGEAVTPRPSAVSIAEEDGLLSIDIEGRITRQDVDMLDARVEGLTDGGRTLKLLTRVLAYDGFEPAILTDLHYLELKLSLLRHVSRCAVIGGPDWMKRTVSLFAPLLRMDLRHFDGGEEEKARAWLKADTLG